MWRHRAKQLFRLSMPLPRAVNYPEEKGRAMRDVDEMLSQEQADMISEQHTDLGFIGYGRYGVAYDTGSREYGTPVVKITSDSTEIGMAQELMKNPVPCCIRIFSAEEAQRDVQNSPLLWKITSEKVEILSKDERDIVHDL